MKSIPWLGLAAISLVTLAGLAGPAAGRADIATNLPAASTIDPMRLYGGEIRFDVLRNDNKVGYHHVRFRRDGADIVADSEFELALNFLIFPVYRFNYRSEGRWRDGRLVGLTAAADDNGETESVVATAVPAGLQISRASQPDGPDAVAGPLFPTTHWNTRVLTQDWVLNTITGRVNQVRIERRGRETVPTEAGPVDATRFAYTGDLQTEVWYDDQGRWVKMRFRARDGSAIEYACRRCQGLPAGQAER